MGQTKASLMDEDELRTSVVRRLAAGTSVSASEALFLARSLDRGEPGLGSGTRQEYYYLTAIVALMAKGPTTDELSGIVEDISERSISLTAELNKFGPLVDISGTGGDKLDTPNVGSLASFVTAAGGVPVAKQATRAFTGVSGSSDVFSLFGLDVLRPDLSRAMYLLRTVGVTALHTPSYSGEFVRRMEILALLRDLDLRIVTPWHLVSWVYSPFPLTGRVYGICANRFRHRIASLFQRHYPAQHTLVVHGANGVDEISVSGPTVVTEIRDGERKDFRVSPESLGLPAFSAQEMSVYGSADFARLQSPELGKEERSVIRTRAADALPTQVLRIVRGEGTPAHEALIAANAGAALYVGGAASSLRDGVASALDLIRSGAVHAKVREFAQACAHAPGSLDRGAVEPSA